MKQIWYMCLFGNLTKGKSNILPALWLTWTIHVIHNSSKINWKVRSYKHSITSFTIKREIQSVINASNNLALLPYVAPKIHLRLPLRCYPILFAYYCRGTSSTSFTRWTDQYLLRIITQMYYSLSPRV